MKIKHIFFLICLALIAVSRLFGGSGIEAGASVSDADFKTGDQVIMPVTVDLSNLSEKLGSFTANISWDTSVLKYISASGAGGPFANPVINDREVAEGRLSFAAANPNGARGKIGILNVTFEIVGQSGSQAGLKLNFSAMAAAHTFKDLLPEVKINLEDLTVAKALPASFSLSQNHPNPFNPTTQIQFAVPQEIHVTVEIYNLLGEQVRTLLDAKQEAGNYDVRWDAKDKNGIEMPAGVYVVQMKAGSFSDMKKMLLVK